MPSTPKRTALAAAAAVCVLFASACTPDGPPNVGRPTPSAARTTAPPRAPVARVVAEPAPIKDEFLLYNPLYRAGQVTAVSCSLPTAKLSNQQTMIRYATAFVACLNKGWGPIVTRAGFDFVPPGAVYPSPPGTKTACGPMEKGYYGLYCDSNRGIYFNWPEYVVPGATEEDTAASVQWLIAHEYGHHVQWLTGIADQYGERYSEVQGAAQQVEENRSEMQAHCFAAAFFGANQKTFRIRGERLSHYGHPGYDRGAADSINFDHWLHQAFKARGPSSCITWAAPASRVTGV